MSSDRKRPSNPLELSRADARGGLILIPAIEVPEKNLRWIVPDLIPLALTMIVGQAGDGKTTWALKVLSDLSCGRIPIIGGSCEAERVVMISNEDDPSDIRRNFVRLGGNLDNLLIEDDGAEWSFDDVEALGAIIDDISPKAVVIDSIGSHTAPTLNLRLRAAIARCMMKLRRLASRKNCLILLVHHYNKSNAVDPLNRIAESQAFISGPRHILKCGKHPEIEDQRVVGVLKTNLAPLSTPTYAFQLDPFAWLGQCEVKTAEIGEGRDPADVERPSVAEALLIEALSEGPQVAGNLIQQAEQGYGISRRTLFRKALKLGVVRQREAFGGKVYWSLPPELMQKKSDGATADEAPTRPSDGNEIDGAKTSDHEGSAESIDVTSDTSKNDINGTDVTPTTSAETPQKNDSESTIEKPPVDSNEE